MSESTVTTNTTTTTTITSRTTTTTDSTFTGTTPPPTSPSPPPTFPPSSTSSSTSTSSFTTTPSSPPSSFPPTTSSTTFPTSTPPPPTTSSTSSTSRSTSSASTQTSTPLLFTTTQVTQAPSTITHVLDPSLSANDNENSSSSAFFSNRGAVAGVFLLVGLLLTSLILYFIFWIRRRRRRQQLQRDADAAAPYGSTIPPHTSSDDHRSHSRRTSRSDMRQRHSFGNTPIVYQNLPLDSPGPDPFASNPFIAQVLSDNHSPTRPTPPSPDATASLLVAAGLGGGAAVGSANSPTGSSDSTDAHASATSSGHHRFSRENERWNSSVSSDPLITASDIKRRSKSTIGDTPPTPPPRSPLRLKHYVPVNQEHSAASLHDEDEDEVQRHDNRLNPNLTADLKRANTEARSMRDNVDYSRPILGVRNIPDDASISVYSRDED